MENMERVDQFLKEEYEILRDELLKLEGEYSDAEIKMKELQHFIKSLEEDASEEDVFSPFNKSRLNSDNISLEKERIKEQKKMLDNLSEKLSLQKEKCGKYEKAMKDLSPILDGDSIVVKKDKFMVISEIIGLCQGELEDLENEFSAMIKKFALVDSNRVLLDSKKYFKRMAKIREKLEECREMLK